MPSFRLALVMAVAIISVVFGQSAVEPLQLGDDVQYRYGVLITVTTQENHVSVWRWVRGEYCAAQQLVIPELLRHSLSDDPGVGSLALDQSRVPEIIDRMIKHGETELAKYGVSAQDSLIFLSCGAGVRRLVPVLRDGIMGQLRELLSATNFLFEDQYLRLESGEEEGMHHWLALTAHWSWNNRTKDHLDAHDDVPAAQYGKDIRRTGFIDISSLAASVTFQPVNQHSILESLLVLDFVRPVRVYSRAFMHYGYDGLHSSIDTKIFRSFLSRFEFEKKLFSHVLAFCFCFYLLSLVFDKI